MVISCLEPKRVTLLNQSLNSGISSLIMGSESQKKCFSVKVINLSPTSAPSICLQMVKGNGSEFMTQVFFLNSV